MERWRVWSDAKWTTGTRRREGLRRRRIAQHDGWFVWKSKKMVMMAMGRCGVSSALIRLPWCGRRKESTQNTRIAQLLNILPEDPRPAKPSRYREAQC